MAAVRIYHPTLDGLEREVDEAALADWLAAGWLDVDATNPTATVARARNVLVPATSGLLGNRWVFLGDSITAGGTENDKSYQADSYPLHVQLASEGRIYMRNAGIGGNRMYQMVDRFEADVAAHNPNVVFLMGGVNDVDRITLEEYADHVEAIRAKCLRIGAALVLSSLTPLPAAANKDNISIWNEWLRSYALRHNLMFVDSFTPVVNPATGEWKDGYSTDRVHPTLIARQVMGRAVWDQVKEYVRPWHMPLLLEATDVVKSGGLINPLFLEDSNADGMPDGWGGYGATNADGAVASIIDNPHGPGNLLQVAATDTTTFRVIQKALPAEAWAPGDRVWIGGRITSDGGVQVDAKITVMLPDNARTVATPARFTAPVEGGVYGLEYTIPANATSVVYEWVVSDGTGVVAMGQPTFLNLTKYGLA